MHIGHPTAYVVSLLAFTTVAQTSAPVNVPPTISDTPEVLGRTKDAAFSDSFYSDGGAGGKVNGYNLIILSDARTVATGVYLVHTVYAYFGVRDPSDPTEITIIGNYDADPHFYLTGSDGSGAGVIVSDSTDSVYGAGFGPGPNTMMVPLGNGTGGINAWTVYNATGDGKPLYNTLIEYNVVDPDTLISNNQNIPAERVIDQLFYADQPLYGQDGFGRDDNYFFLLALDDSGYKLARVLQGQHTDKTAYLFWHNDTQSWTSDVLILNDDTSNLYNPPPIGGGIFGSDLFFSAYFNTWIITYSQADIYTAKYLVMAYSVSGIPEGPYQDLGTIYKPTSDPDCANVTGSTNLYLIHSHPGWDESGRTLLVSWESCDTFTNMALITFE